MADSHIIPEFLYRRTYEDTDKGQRTLLIKSDGEEFVEKPIQKGYWENLLCEECEGHLNSYETYTAKVLFEDPIQPIPYDGGFKLEGLKYKEFQLFHLSILWRCSIAESGGYENISLGPHEEKLRKRILEENPGNENVYPFFVTKLKFNHEIFDKCILPPVETRLYNHRIFLAVYGGYSWNFKVSSHVSRRFNNMGFKEDGTLFFVEQDALKHPVLKSIIERRR